MNRKLTPESLQNWSFAIMIALFFLSCGACAVIDVVERVRGACGGSD